MGFFTMKDILQKTTDTLLDRAVTFTVSVEPKNKLHRLLQHWKIKPKVRTFMIQPLNFGTMIKISRVLLDIDVSVFRQTNALDAVYKVLDTNGDKIASIVAMAFVNRKRDPDASLIEFIKDNFTSKELLQALMIVLNQMDVTSFMSSIVSMRGLNLLQETSQKVPGEIIASGKPSEQQSNISDSHGMKSSGE